MSNRQDALWALVERYADEVHDYNQAVRIDVGIDKAGRECLVAEKALRDAIASLQALLDAAEKDAGWIAVAERLPEPTGKHGYSEHVLCAIVCGSGLRMVRCDRWDSHSKSWEEYHTDYSYTVTHWRHLPAAPEAE